MTWKKFSEEKMGRGRRMTTKKGKKIEEMKDYALSERIAELEKMIRELKKTVVESQRCSPAIIDKDAMVLAKIDKNYFKL